jgi:DNA-binding response OmpR family regulator
MGQVAKFPQRGKRNIRQEAGLRSKKLTILFVDDHDEQRDVVSHFLLRHGYKVHTASNGIAALDILAAEEVHVLLLDLMMPEFDGFSVLQRLQERGGGRPYIIVTSALNREADRRMVRELGGDEYLPKPFLLSALLDRLVLVEDRLCREECTEQCS